MWESVDQRRHANDRQSTTPAIPVAACDIGSYCSTRIGALAIAPSIGVAGLTLFMMVRMTKLTAENRRLKKMCAAEQMKAKFPKEYLEEDQTAISSAEDGQRAGSQ